MNHLSDVSGPALPGAGALYHYTTAQGLIGIIRSRQVWATESNFMNDPTEVSFASTVLIGQLRDRLTAGPSNQGLTDKLSRIITFLEDAYADSHSSAQYREDRVFIASFSRRDDHLTLWRSYAKRNGFCVGFSEPELTSWLGQDGYPSLENEQSLFRDELERNVGLRNNYQLEGRIADLAYGASSVGELVDQLMALETDADWEWKLHGILRRLAEVKHDAFADERETRLIVQEVGDHAPARAVRASPSMGLVSYHQVTFPYAAVRSITIAPGSNAAQARSALTSLLDDGGRGAWSHVAVRECDIPYAW